MPGVGMAEVVGADDASAPEGAELGPPTEAPVSEGPTPLAGGGGEHDGGDGGASPGRGERGRTLPLSAEIARVTGLLLVVLLPIHLVTMLLADPRDVAELLERWEDRRWLAADWSFLTVGVVHSLLALRPRLLALGGTRPGPACPHCGGELEVAPDPFGRVCFALVTVVAVGLYVAASWAMLRLV